MSTKTLRSVIRKYLIEAAYDAKDKKRVIDMFTRSKGSDDKLLQLARTMASRITDPMKATRRGEAAKAAVDAPDFYNIFFDRAKELGLDPDDKSNAGFDRSSLKRGTGIIWLPTWSAIELWQNEITGQLSDGYWENSVPHDHWMPWSKMEVKKGNPKAIYNGWIQRNKYAVDSKDLIDIVGDRMVNKGRMAKALGRELTYDESNAAEGLPENIADYKDMIASNKSDYTIDKIKKLKKKDVAAFYSTEYDMAEMKRDLKFIKKAMSEAK